MPRPSALRVLALLLVSGAALAVTAGPDADGVLLTDSDEAGGPPVGLLDLSGVASLGLSDGGSTDVVLPFEVELYGTTTDTLTVSNEGVVFVSAATSTASCPGDGTGSWAGIAAFWDDWAADAVTVHTVGRYPHRTWVAEWSGAHGTAGGDGRVQLWILEGRSDAVLVLDDITFGDAAVDGGAAAVVGAQGGAASGVAWSCSGGLADGTAAWLGPYLDRPSSPIRGTSDLETPWTGTDASQLLGRDLSAGDLNGDGLTDVVLGNPDEDSAWVAGGTTGVWGTSVDQALAVLVGDPGTELGGAVLLADLDGDGLDDLVAGAVDDDSAGARVGAVAVVAGQGAIGGQLTLSADADGVWTGPSAARAGTTGTAPWVSPRAGSAVAAGDLNGDGHVDLVVGAEEDDSEDVNAGAAYVVYGSVSTLGGAASLDDADVVLPGTLAGDHLGAELLVADLDADGFDDLVIAAPFAEPTSGPSNAGRAFVVLGGALSGVVDVSSAAVATVDGSTADAEASRGLAVGDPDGDGLIDLLVGAPFDSTAGAVAGAAGVFSDAGVLSGALDLVSDADAVLLGESSGDYLGGALAAVDLDGDGVDDVVVGASGVDVDGETGAGTVAVVLGPTSGTQSLSSADHRIQGEEAGAAVGASLAVLEDSDGDGDSEVALAAPYGSVGALRSAGQVFRFVLIDDFPDADGDGFVDVLAGGNDCDDADAAASPALTETLGDVDDDDCDGWIDDVVLLRLEDDLWAYDLDAVLGADPDTDADLIDVEDESSGDDLSLAFQGTGLRLVASTEVAAAPDVYGSRPEGDLAARVVGDGSDNAVLMAFDDDVDAVSFQLLDPSGPFTVTALSGSDTVIDGELFDLSAEDRAGGAFVGLVFAESIDTLVLAADPGDGWGFDDLRIVWADGTDRDGDGYSDADGDCDDGDSTISPGATEDLTNGVDDDCDGIIDGGSAGAYSDPATWAGDTSITPQTIDFETLVEGDAVSLDYVDLGVLFDGTVSVSSDVDGSGPVGALAGEAQGSSLTLVFQEVQPAVAFTALDIETTLSVEGSVGGTVLYSTTVAPAGDDLDEGVFVGFDFGYGVDTLTITADSVGDVWGIDDLVMSELGLDDADGDGYTEADGDCDDSDATASPGATEVWYDGVDSDCSGTSDYDIDGDGYDSSAYGGLDCDDGDDATSPDAEEIWYDGIDTDCSGTSDYDIDGDGYDSSAYGGTDCDDTESTTSPGATEVWYDGVDSDCAEDDDYDADGDGFRSGSGSGGGGGGIGGGGSGAVDCDDGDATVSPGATETWYDGVDSDCSGESDFDVDGDGYDSTEWGGTDCNDDDADVNPGATADACYDGEDTDCDGWSDYDCDRDGYDSDDYGGLDCDDADDSVNPLATDTPGDGIDTDCDGAPEFDDDGDGYDGVEDGGEDCDDTDATIGPGAVEVWYDGVDQDCSGGSDYDADSDGQDSDAWGGLDCDDTDGSIYTGAFDFAYDGVDSNCDGTDDYDLDGDGYASVWYGGLDCDDDDAAVSPAAADVWYDGVDSDCSGTSDYDADGDGFDSDVYGGLDCDDTTAAVAPGVGEVVGDGVDQDCDGIDDVDDDGDGVYSRIDCDDSRADVYPGAPDACYDGIDADCAGDSDQDCDDDGEDIDTAGGTDCDDSDPAVFTGAIETWYDGVDSDCDGASDYDADGDGSEADLWGGEDCADLDDTIGPHVVFDDCGGGDEDCDGDVDEDCATGGSSGGGSGDGSGGDAGDGGSDDGGADDGSDDGGAGDGADDGGSGDGGSGDGSGDGGAGDGSDDGGSGDGGAGGGSGAGDGGSAGDTGTSADDGGDPDPDWTDPNAGWTAPPSGALVDDGKPTVGCGCSGVPGRGSALWISVLALLGLGARRRRR